MQTKSVFTALCIAMTALSATAAEPIWRSTIQTVYEPSERDETKLVESYTSRLEYNKAGQVTVDEQTPVSGTRMRQTIAYDEAGRVTLETTEVWSKGAWTTYRTKERKYDERTGVIVENLEYMYDGGQKLPGNCYRRNITRNDNGDITAVEIAVYYNGEFDPTKRTSIIYDAEGRATEITTMDLLPAGTTLAWVQGEHYTDLEWENTDGQIVSTDDLYRGENRIKSGHYENNNNGKPYHNYDISVSYGEGTDFKATITGLYQNIDNSLITRDYKVTTDNDGNTTTSLETIYDVTTESAPEGYMEVSVVDSWGFEREMSSYEWEGDGEKELLTQVITDVTYNEQGLPTEALTVEDGMDLVKIIYDGYVDCTVTGAIRHIGGAEAAMPAEHFDLQGRRISHDARGFHIERRGNETIKRFRK